MWPEYDMFVAWIWTVLGLDLGLFFGELWHVCVACDGYMCGVLCGHLLCHNWS